MQASVDFVIPTNPAATRERKVDALRSRRGDPPARGGGTRTHHVEWAFGMTMSASGRWGSAALTRSPPGEARERARNARHLVADGIEPIDRRATTRKPAVKSLTFRECAERYAAERQAKWKGSNAN